MKTKLFVILNAMFILCGVASAQSYSIRVTFNTNLRSAGSLQASIIETAASGTTLNVVSELNRWLRISRNGNEVWMASWVGHTRVESDTQTQTSTQATSNIDNCCFVDRQCSNDQEWTDGYWAFQNGLCAVPAQTQAQVSTQPVTTTAPQIDNCCFVDRQCNSDQEWVSGYYSFQNGQCGAPVQTQTQVSTQPVTTAPNTITVPEGVDNCCQVNRQCHSNDDWVSGFHAYRDNQCAGVALTTSTAPITGPIPEGVDNCCFVNWQCHTEQDYIIGYEQFKYGLCHVPDIAGVINISGSGAFVSKTRAALRILLEKEPKWYRYVQSALLGVKEIPMGGDSGIFPDEAVYRSWPNFRSERTGEGHVIWVAGQLVHEACHVHRYKAGLESGGYAGEKACTETQIQALDDIDPSGNVAASRRRALANIDDPEHQWWRFH